MRRLLPVLIVAALAPAPADGARRSGAAVDDGGWKHFLFDPRGPAPAAVVDRVESTLSLVEPDAFERTVTAAFEQPAGTRATLALAEYDPTLGESCALAGDDDPVEESDDPEEATDWGPELVLSGPDSRGVLTCSVVAPLGGGERTVSVVVRRPRVEGLDDRFAFRLAAQPLAAAARVVVFSVEAFAEAEPAVQLLRWDTPLRKQALDGGKLRLFYEIENVRARPAGAGLRSLAGRVPEVVVTSGDLWDDVGLDHRLQYLKAARATGPVIGMAGRVLGRGGGWPSVQEAARIALDEIELDPSGGAGGTWRLPQSAQYTLEEKRGTVADRAALLMALLRTAEVGAEVVFTTTDGAEPHPDRVVPVLDRTLVYVPDVLLPDGRPLFVDPSRSSAWLGELEELLAGRSALLLAPEGVRWLRLPGDLRASSWSLRATEGEDGAFAVTIQGRLQGASAARVRAWGGAAEEIPAQDLVWAAGAWADALETTVSEGPQGTVIVQASGTLPRELMVAADGSLIGPPLPRIVVARPSAETAEVLGVDARLFALDLRESWRFRGRRPGAGSPSFKRTTPFWTARTLASWTGPLFNRETTVSWTGRHLSPNAAGEDQRFTAQLADLFAEVKPPPASAP